MTATRRSRRRGGVLYKLFSVAIIIVALIVGMTVFFKISKIRVEGCSINTESMVTQAAGAEIGENLFMINKAEMANKILTSLPYVRQVVLQRELPDTLVIKITECSAVAAIESDYSDYWLIDETGKLLQKLDVKDTGGLPLVAGVKVKSPTAGDILSFSDEEREKEQQLKDLLAALKSKGLTADLTEIELETSYAVGFKLSGKYRVLLGTTENLDYKLEYLEAVLPKLPEGATGEIDLSDLVNGNEAHFIPDA